MSLVPASLVHYTAYALTYGEIKYAAHNWRNGFKWSSLIDSASRHFEAFKEGQDFDEESGLPHIALLACNIAFLVEHFDKGMGEDDRFVNTLKGRQLAFNPPPLKPTGSVPGVEPPLVLDTESQS
jgi:hypothetical protein